MTTLSHGYSVLSLYCVCQRVKQAFLKSLRKPKLCRCVGVTVGAPSLSIGVYSTVQYMYVLMPELQHCLLRHRVWVKTKVKCVTYVSREHALLVVHAGAQKVEGLCVSFTVEAHKVLLIRHPYVMVIHARIHDTMRTCARANTLVCTIVKGKTFT